jgi:hypothetical protein
LSNNNVTLWKILKDFMGTVEFFSNNQTAATAEVLNATFAQQLPKYEQKLANITECVNTRVTKAPKPKPAAG